MAALAAFISKWLSLVFCHNFPSRFALLLGHKYLCTKPKGYPYCRTASTIILLLLILHQRMTVLTTVALCAIRW